MKLNGIQILQFVSMIIIPIVVQSNVRPKDMAIMTSGVVIALLFVGISICAVANAIQDRNQLRR